MTATLAQPPAPTPDQSLANTDGPALRVLLAEGLERRGVHAPDLTPAQWAAIWPLIEEAWALRMTSAGVAAVLEASPPCLTS